jgi:hypothetical protein
MPAFLALSCKSNKTSWVEREFAKKGEGPKVGLVGRLLPGIETHSRRTHVNNQ